MGTVNNDTAPGGNPAKVWHPGAGGVYQSSSTGCEGHYGLWCDL